jgi:hypothetical protein
LNIRYLLENTTRKFTTETRRRGENQVKVKTLNTHNRPGQATGAEKLRRTQKDGGMEDLKSENNSTTETRRHGEKL